jgi:hypothetical protein
VTFRGLLSRPATWWIVAGIAGVIFCVLATNNTVYVTTSPPSFDYYVVLRKLYSVVAFALVGMPAALARRAEQRSASPAVIGGIVAAYSAFIEVLQYFLDPPPEGLLWNAVDVACGFLGGAAAALIATRLFVRGRGQLTHGQSCACPRTPTGWCG